MNSLAVFCHTYTWNLFWISDVSKTADKKKSDSSDNIIRWEILSYQLVVNISQNFICVINMHWVSELFKNK